MIKDLIGIPFEWWGRSRTGADCVGLTLLALAELGVCGVADPWLHVQSHYAAGLQGIPKDSPPPGWKRLDLLTPLRPGLVIEHEDTSRGTEKFPRGHLSIVAEEGWSLQTSEDAGQSFLAPVSRVLRAQRLRPAALWEVSSA